MEYEGYSAKITYDYDEKVFRGEVLNIADVPPFFGTSVDELEVEFKLRVDEHLAMLVAKRSKWVKPFTGRFSVHIPPELHEKIYVMGQRSGKSIKQIIIMLLIKGFEVVDQEKLVEPELFE